MKSLFRYGLWVLPLMLAACANVQQQNVPTRALSSKLTADERAQQALGLDRKFDTSKGLRYYTEAAYVLMWADGHGISWQIVFLPVQSQKMTLEPQTVLSQTDSTLTFKDGVLLTTNDVIDATAFPNAVLDAIGKLVPAALAAFADAPAAPYPEPVLCRLNIRNATVTLDGQTVSGKSLQVSSLVKEVKP